ncbi:alpha/beta hydrolase [Blastococcus jejuensis]|uniref:Alpha/beta hydrolase n=1 Tax=Blastococcus jejuensis TaxID=351224 RepID=A0ABP6PJD5_9ACTN
MTKVDAEAYWRGIRYFDRRPADIGQKGHPTHLFLHGLAGSLDQWKLVIRQMDESIPVLALDIPGFGAGASTADAQFTIDDAVGKLVDFCEHEEVRNCVLVSHSIGCVIAGRLAAEMPAVFTRVILVSGALDSASELAQCPIRALSHPRLGFSVGAAFFAGMSPVPPSLLHALAASPRLRQLSLWPFVAEPAALKSGDILETLAHTGSPSALRVLRDAARIPHREIIRDIPQPVDLLWGERDRLISREDIDLLRSTVRLDRERSIPDCGHWPWIEKPGAVADFIQSSHRA